MASLQNKVWLSYLWENLTRMKYFGEQSTDGMITLRQLMQHCFVCDVFFKLPKHEN